ncbi:hypothetical protein KC330_g194 [Hortaea werneckii]|nr:hypothetical protein KC330_g194 [Hortaea werneckii]
MRSLLLSVLLLSSEPARSIAEASCSNSFKLLQGLSVNPTTCVFPPPTSRIGRPAGVRFSGGSNRSKTRSL